MVKEGYLTCREVVDTFVTKEIVVELITQLIQIGHGNEDVFDIGI
jgi:hypothetical protein